MVEFKFEWPTVARFLYGLLHSSYPVKLILTPCVAFFEEIEPKWGFVGDQYFFQALFNTTIRPKVGFGLFSFGYSYCFPTVDCL